MENAKGGVWKRRVRIKGICSGAKAESGKENVSSGQNMASKRGFFLKG